MNTTKQWNFHPIDSNAPAQRDIALQKRGTVRAVDVPDISKSQFYDNFRKTMKAPGPTGRYIATQLDSPAPNRFQAAWGQSEEQDYKRFVGYATVASTRCP